MTDLFSYGPKNLKEFFRVNLRAILYTIIVHLLVFIVLIFTKAGGLKQDRELGVAIDFTEEASLEDYLNKENIDVPEEWIEKVIEARQQASNRAVNLNDKINQEISTEDYVNKLLDELEAQKDEDFKLKREKLKEIISSAVFEDDANSNKKKTEEEKNYTGPTTISYEFLDAPKSRSKRDLFIPVYRCEGSALIVVDLIVHQDGTVSDVSIVSAETLYESDCFIQAAQNAAKKSYFKSDFTAPEKQRARITYQFVAQ